jgi:hypothetical protein
MVPQSSWIIVQYTRTTLLVPLPFPPPMLPTLAFTTSSAFTALSMVHFASSSSACSLLLNASQLGFAAFSYSIATLAFLALPSSLFLARLKSSCALRLVLASLHKVSVDSFISPTEMVHLETNLATIASRSDWVH